MMGHLHIKHFKLLRLHETVLFYTFLLKFTSLLVHSNVVIQIILTLEWTYFEMY